MSSNPLSRLDRLRYVRPNNLKPLYDFAAQLRDKALSVPSNLACNLSSAEWFERQVLWPRYQRGLERHRQHLPQLDASEREIAEGLEREGIWMTSLDALAIPGTSQLLAAAAIVTAELSYYSRQADRAGKHTLMASANQLLAHPEMLRWGLAERILKIVECYLRLPVGYGGLSFYYSVADGREIGPRLWHRDREDWRMLKVAIYLNDVDETGGPYQSIAAVANDWLVTHLSGYRNLSHRYMQDLVANFPTEWLVSCTGKTGTVIFTDTARCYHRGKPPTHKDRAAIFYHYFSERPKNPYICDRMPLSPQQVLDFNRQLPLHLQGYLTWRDRYPGIGCYIPKNYMRVDNW